MVQPRDSVPSAFSALVEWSSTSRELVCGSGVWGVERVESGGEEFGASTLVSSVARDARSPGRGEIGRAPGPELDQLASDVSLRASDSRGPIAELADSTRFRPLRLAA